MNCQRHFLYESLNIAKEFDNYFSDIGSKMAEKRLLQIVYLSIPLAHMCVFLSA